MQPGVDIRERTSGVLQRDRSELYGGRAEEDGEEEEQD